MIPRKPLGQSCSIKKPTTKNRGLNLTVCIAGLCESGRKLVCISDQLLTFAPQMTAIEGISKDHAVHKNWFALYAANDMGDVSPIMERATMLMVLKKRDLAVTEAMDAFTHAFMVRHQQLLEYRILKPNGFRTLDQFTEQGKDRLPPEEYRRIKRLMSKTKPECEFLVGGFDLMGLGHLFKQSSSGPAQGFDEPGWWAIGCGEGEAISALEFQAHRLGFSVESSEAECVYHLLSAKFMAESNRLVGQRTFVTCHAFNEQVRYINHRRMDEIREAWEMNAIPRMPKGLIRKIPGMLFTAEEAEASNKRMEDFIKKMGRSR